MKTFITVVMLSISLVMPALAVNGHEIKPNRQMQPDLPAQVVARFESLVSEIVTTNFGEIAYETSVEWVFCRGQWLASAIISVTRSSGIEVHAGFRPNGAIVQYDYVIF